MREIIKVNNEGVLRLLKRAQIAEVNRFVWRDWVRWRAVFATLSARDFDYIPDQLSTVLAQLVTPAPTPILRLLKEVRSYGSSAGEKAS